MHETTGLAKSKHDPVTSSTSDNEPPPVTPDRVSRWLYLLALMLAGECVYLLPYLRKSFQTSMEEAYRVDAVELGLINGMFGVLALASYLPGGWLADRFGPRSLLTFSLFATGLGGFVMLLDLSFNGLLALHAAWGMTSVLTFWAALIKATRAWGGEHRQGLSFGLLDGGRGVIAAVMVSLATAVFAYAATPVDGLKSVIILYASAACLAGIAVWVFVKDVASSPGPTSLARQNAVRGPGWQSSLRRLRAVTARQDTWLLALIIFCAYFLFLGTYEFPAYAERGFGQSKLFGAQLATFRDWMRPLAAIAAGLLADRFRASWMLSASFALLVLSYLVLAALPGQSDGVWRLWLPVATAALAVFALRGVYYAVLQEARIPLALTGTTVGFVSLLGYLPDVFAPALAGWFVVTFDNGAGYRIYFALLSAVAVAGLAASIAIARHHAQNHEES